MGKEIERKFLVEGQGWKAIGPGSLLRQGYLSSNPDRIVRVRIDGDKAMLTIKGRSVGASRGEWEYGIPLEDAQIFLDELCEKPMVEKIRYRIAHGGMTWEVDEFLGENTGLVIAEIELDTEDQLFALPDWIGAEVTDDPRYYNSNLLRHPYCRW